MKKFSEELLEKFKNRVLEKFNTYFDTTINGIKYLGCVTIVVIAFKHLIKFALKQSNKNNIQLTGTEYVNLLKDYGLIVVFVILIGLLLIPAVKLANRLKSLSKDRADFGEEVQNTSVVSEKGEIQKDTVEDIINSDDEETFDEIREENIYKKRIKSIEETNNFLKCKNIKNSMKPLTVLVTMELYNNNKECITKEVVLDYICNVKNRKKKKLEEQNKKIAKNIIEFLKNNDIIESDDMENGKYYFTPFGNTFMNFFQNGII